MKTTTLGPVFSTRKRVWLARLALLIGGCLVGVLLAEVGLRVMGFRLGTDSAFQADPWCGVRHVPGYRGWHTREGRSWIEINSHGCRDRPRTVAKPAGTFRIAVLGDSYAEAFQVDLDKTFWSVMEEQIARALAGARPARRSVELRCFRLRHGSGTGNAEALCVGLRAGHDPAPVLRRERRAQQFSPARGRQRPPLLHARWHASVPRRRLSAGPGARAIPDLPMDQAEGFLCAAQPSCGRGLPIAQSQS